MNKRIILFVIVFWMIFAVVSVNIGITDGEQYSARAGGNGLTAHEPILIDGNADFASQASSEGWTGGGTEGNPYIIENYDIDASTANGIHIENTDVYFIIRNCTIHDGESNYNDGIRFFSVQNGKIDNVTSYNNYYGISLYYSSNNTITNCAVYNNYDAGIVLSYSSNNNIISNCAVYNNNYYGILLNSSSNNNLRNNTFTNDGIHIWGNLDDCTQTIENNTVNNKPLYYFLNEDGITLDGIDAGQLILVNTTNFNIKNLDISYTEIGIELFYSSNNQITNCAVYNNSCGIFLSSSSNNQITNCTVYNNSYHGIGLGSSSNNQISNCAVYNNYDDGIGLYSSSNNEIHYNNIYNNTNYGVNNSNTELEYQVNATSNWWGSASGPYHLTTNPSGTGDNVTDNVLYTPWLPDPVKIETDIPSEGGVNNPPTLSNGSVSPLSGNLDTVFQFNVTYTDADNDTPSYVNVIIDGVAHNMTKQNIGDSDYTDGCVYKYSTTLPKDFHSYSFEASDGINTTSTLTVHGIRVTEKEGEKIVRPFATYYTVLIVIIIVTVEIAGGGIFLIKRKKTMRLKCPKCSTIFKVKRKKEPFKTECPTCGATGTIGKPAAEKKTPPEKPLLERPTRNLRCPKCKKTFTVEEKEKPFKVKCPHCGKEGTIK